MDPTATLRAIQRGESVAELVRAYNEWRGRGGAPAYVTDPLGLLGVPVPVRWLFRGHRTVRAELSLPPNVLVYNLSDLEVVS